jgi:hypothetical protein
MTTLNQQSELSTDTLRTIKAICKNGYYESNTTLGVGGWPELYSKIGNDWKTYRLYACHEGNHFDAKITAKDDKTAIKAFRDKYFLGECEGWHIDEEVQRNRTIAEA